MKSMPAIDAAQCELVITLPAKANFEYNWTNVAFTNVASEMGVYRKTKLREASCSLCLVLGLIYL
jgi:hypothetical protein